MRKMLMKTVLIMTDSVKGKALNAEASTFWSQWGKKIDPSLVFKMFD